MKHKNRLVVYLVILAAFVAVLLGGCATAATPTPTATAAPPTATATATPTATAATTATATATATAPAAAIAAGKQLFDANCATCHGADGAGGKQVDGATSADLRQSALQPLYKNNHDLLSAAILTGVDQDGNDLDSAMPRFQDKLTQTQVNDIIDYIFTLK